MAKYDGTIRIDTSVDNKGLLTGLKGIGSLAAKAVAATATALGGLAAAAVNVGMDFESAMSEVAAISGATGNELEKLKAKAMEMGATTKFSATQSAEALKYMAMAGWKTNQMVDGLSGIMNLAAASGEDLATTSDIVTDALTGFGLSAEDSSHFADILAVASSNANTNVGLMGETFKYVAPVAGSLGYSAEDVAEAIGLIANAGIKGSQAGTSLRSIMSRLATDAGASSKSLGALGILTEKLGVQFYNSDGTVRAFNDVISESREAWKSLTAEEQQNYAKKIAGEEALSAWSALMNASSADVAKLENALINCDGAAQAMADTMNDNLKGQITLLQSALEGLGIQFYESVDNPMKDVVKTANDMVGQLSTAFSNGGFEGLVSSLGDVLAQAVTYLVSYAPHMVDAAFSLLQSFGSGLMSNSGTLIDSGMSIVNTLLTGIVNALPGMANAAIQLIGQLGNAIIAEIPKIAELGGQLLDNLSSGIQSGFGDFINNALDLIEGFADSLTENLPILLQKGCEMLQNLAQGIADALPTLIARVPEIISKFANLINDNAPTILKSGINIIITLVKGIIQAIPTLIANIPKIISAIVDVWSAFNWVSLGKNAITFLKDGIAGMVGAVKGAGKNVLDGITGALKNLPNTLKNLGKNAIEFLKSGISGMKSKAVEAAKGILDAVVSSIKTLPDKMLSIGKNIVQGLWDGIKNMTKWMTDKVKDFAGSILKGIKDVLGINSPSKITRGYGEFLAEGLGLGFEKSLPNVQRSLLSDIKAMTGKMQAVVALENSKIAANAQQGGSVTNSSVTNNTTNNQSLNFYSQVQTPSQIARAARKAQEVTG